LARDEYWTLLGQASSQSRRTSVGRHCDAEWATSALALRGGGRMARRPSQQWAGVAAPQAVVDAADAKQSALLALANTRYPRSWPRAGQRRHPWLALLREWPACGRLVASGHDEGDGLSK
jgi:hypothetical protein